MLDIEKDFSILKREGRVQKSSQIIYIRILINNPQKRLIIAENIPETSESIPLIGIYLAVLISFTSTSIILTVFVLRMHYGGSFVPRISRKFYRFMTIYLASIVGLSSTVQLYEMNKKLSTTSSILVYQSPRKESLIKTKKHYQRSFQNIDSSYSHSKTETNNLKNEWKLIALIFDRFFFWFYFIITFSFSVIILIILPNLKYITLFNN